MHSLQPAEANEEEDLVTIAEKNFLSAINAEEEKKKNKANASADG